jgi:hypothetical protein
VGDGRAQTEWRLAEVRSRFRVGRDGSLSPHRPALFTTLERLPRQHAQTGCLTSKRYFYAQACYLRSLLQATMLIDLYCTLPRPMGLPE